MSSSKSLKTMRQLKERAAEIRRQGKVSIRRSMELAAREHGFESLEIARDAIAAQSNPQLGESLRYDLISVPE